MMTTVIYPLIFIAGILCTLIFKADIMCFIMWIKHSWEEKDGRASGKALASFLFCVILSTVCIRIVNRPPELADYQPNQVILLNSVMSNLVYLILGLYLLKNFSQSTAITTFLSRFSNGNNNNNGNNGQNGGGNGPGNPSSTPTNTPPTP